MLLKRLLAEAELEKAALIVSIVDQHTRECLGGLVERSITGGNLITDLDLLATDSSPPPLGPKLPAPAHYAATCINL